MKDNVLNQIIDDYKVLYHKEKEKRKELQQRIDKAIEMLNELNIKLKDILKTKIDIKDISDIKQILGDKENEK